MVGPVRTALPDNLKHVQTVSSKRCATVAAWRISALPKPATDQLDSGTFAGGKLHGNDGPVTVGARWGGRSSQPEYLSRATDGWSACKTSVGGDQRAVERLGVSDVASVVGGDVRSEFERSQHQRPSRE